ncbi:uncharacterized protein LOC113498765 [Trichoplusia ni]|uniref:Uncharacterized protein LOC113498765 n=1 Tax=Trichoplusia ni TaxID=7111 RepID=A0A7E5W264_TRINI|nr:uncharacterized protein LOC113498765 [Trichoplusia ni]
MSAKNDKTLESTSTQTEADSSSSSDFIDDYSQLRLSYYQQRSEFDISTTDSYSDETFNTAETDLSEVPKDPKETERQKLRDYYISQIPDLPHPAYTVASIISAASRKMGPIHFRYNDRIEQGDEIRDSRNDLEFAPERRSTLKPNQFPNN